jgi:hypothetical protein
MMKTATMRTKNDGDLSMDRRPRAAAAKTLWSPPCRLRRLRLSVWKNT